MRLNTIRLMQYRFILFSFLFILFIGSPLSSCIEDDNVKVLPGSTGKYGELIVVMDKRYWNGELGLAVRKTLGFEHLALPQPEPYFNLVNIPHSVFKGLFKTHRNILILSVGSEQEKLLKNIKNKWASSQLVVNISGPDANVVIELLNSNKSNISNGFLVRERNRLRGKYTRIEDKSVSTIIKEHFNINFSVPKGYSIASKDEDFIWIRKETPDISQGILIYKTLYTSDSTFTRSSIIADRDSITKKYIPGPLEDSYMTTVHDYPAHITTIDFMGIYAIETRGLWKVEGDFMGGPFLSYTFLSPNKKEVISLEGYVYAPKYKKRNYLREIEAILYSFSPKD